MGLMHPKPYRVKRGEKWIWVYPPPVEYATKHLPGIGTGQNHKPIGLFLVEKIENRKFRP